MEIKLEQGSAQWLEYRRDKIFASEIAIILGVSPFATPLTLWQRKLGFIPEQKVNYAMQRGNDLEPIVRDLANIELDCQFKPAVMVHDEIQWIGASLDGIDKRKKAILEIKCPGIKDHKIAESGEVPKKYYPQIQTQLFCSNLKTCYYASFFKDNLVFVKVKRDDDYIANTILPKASEFYKCLTEMIEPEKSEDDYTQITDPQFAIVAEKWKMANQMKKGADKEEKALKEELIKFTDDGNCQGFGVKMTRVNRQGSLDLDKFLEDLKEQFPEVLESLSLDNYRKEQVGYWKVSEDKGEK